MIIIVIPIEIKIREFLPKLYLTYNIIKNTNCHVLFAGQRFIYNKIRSFKDVIYFDKNTHHTRLFKNSDILKRNILCMLDEEGPISFYDKDTMCIRYHQNIKKLINHFFLWGKKDLKNFTKAGFSKNTTTISGHPKFDLINNKNLRIFEEEVRKIKKKYNNFIFFPSSFESDPIKNLSTTKSQYKTFFKNFSKKVIFQKINRNIKERLISQKNYTKTVEMLINLANKFPDLNIVFRKHPYESHVEVLKRFGNKPKNLHIIYKYTVTPWIIACDIYIHGGCTTSLEASVLNKKNFMYVPIKTKTIREKELSKLADFYSNEKRLFSKIENYFIKNKILKSSNKIINLISNHNLKKSFYKYFIKFISNYKKLNSQIIYEDEKKIFKNISYFVKKIIFRLLSSIKNLILSSNLAEFLPEQHSYSKASALNKFKDIKINEIKKYFTLFHKTQKNQFKYKIKKIDNSVFLINKTNQN